MFTRTLLFLVLLSIVSFHAAVADEICGMQRTSYGNYTVWRSADLLVFKSGMTIDADGSPRAYHPEDKGLDTLTNAGVPGEWSALATRDGEPIVQGEGDPAPGYFVSMTSLADYSRTPLQRQFVDAEEVPYIALPKEIGAMLGEVAAVINSENGNVSGAIYADMGPREHLGEGSIALARRLGINDNARWGGTRDGVMYIVFLGSGRGRPLSVEQIDSESQRLWDANRVDEILDCVEESE